MSRIFGSLDDGSSSESSSDCDSCSKKKTTTTTTTTTEVSQIGERSGNGSKPLIPPKKSNIGSALEDNDADSDSGDGFFSSVFGAGSDSDDDDDDERAPLSLAAPAAAPSAESLSISDMHEKLRAHPDYATKLIDHPMKACSKCGTMREALDAFDTHICNPTATTAPAALAVAATAVVGANGMSFRSWLDDYNASPQAAADADLRARYMAMAAANQKDQLKPFEFGDHLAIGNEPSDAAFDPKAFAAQVKAHNKQVAAGAANKEKKSKTKTPAAPATTTEPAAERAGASIEEKVAANMDAYLKSAGKASIAEGYQVTHSDKIAAAQFALHEESSKSFSHTKFLLAQGPVLMRDSEERAVHAQFSTMGAAAKFNAEHMKQAILSGAEFAQKFALPASKKGADGGLLCIKGVMGETQYDLYAGFAQSSNQAVPSGDMVKIASFRMIELNGVKQLQHQTIRKGVRHIGNAHSKHVVNTGVAEVIESAAAFSHKADRSQ